MICPNCKISFSNKKHPEQKTCSVKCARVFFSKKEPAKCLTCSSVWLDYPHNNKRVKNRFCSRKSMGVALTKKLINPDVGKAWRGKKMPITMRVKMSNSAKKGKNSHFWKGGVTPLRMQIRSLFIYNEWRGLIFKRDNISSLGEAIGCSELWSTENGRTLCIPCHKNTPTYLKRLPLK